VKKLNTYLYYPFALCVLAFTVVMLTKILPYMTFERAIHFLGTKPDRVLDNPYFMVAFYIHVTSSVFVLGGGVFQFSIFLIKKYPRIHQWIGKIYVTMTLLLAAPSGLIIAVYANGGMSSQVGFMLQCVVWWMLTFWAYEAVLEKKWLLHSQMMLRSFALTLAAMSLRTESFALHYFFHTQPMETYDTVTWLSWVGNLLLVEVFIHYGLGEKLVSSMTNVSKNY
jgi:Predicted membrane protein (DUF2306)